MKKNIETIFKEKFNNFSVEPSERVWQNIEKQLPKNNTLFHNKTLWFSSAFIGFLFAFSILVLFNKNNSQNILPKNFDYQQLKILKERPLVYNIASNEKIEAHQTPYNNNIIGEQKPLSFVEKQNSFDSDVFDETDKNFEEKNFLQDNYSLYDDEDDDDEFLKLTASKERGCVPLSTEIDANIKINRLWVDNNEIKIEKLPYQLTFKQDGEHLVVGKTFRNYDTLIINALPRPIADFEVPETVLVRENIEIKNLSQNATQFIWDFGNGEMSEVENPQDISFLSPGEYFIKLIAISTDGCSDTTEKRIVVKEEEKYLVFPNAIMPNMAGPTGGYYNPNSPRNDIFYPVVIKKDIVEYQMIILDRNGNIVYKSNNVKIGWDGYSNGKLVPMGTYVYIVEGKFADGTTFSEKGDVSVIYSK